MMDINDNVLEQLNNFLDKHSNNLPKTELGFFLSRQEKAYRMEAVETMFCSLDRDRQNMVLKYLVGAIKLQYN